MNQNVILCLFSLAVSSSACRTNQKDHHTKPQPVLESSTVPAPVEVTNAAAAVVNKPEIEKLPGNVIICSESRPGYVTGCKVNQQELAPVQEKLSSFYVSYQMTCNRSFDRPVMSNIAVKLENGQERMLNFNQPLIEINAGTGKGPLVLLELSPRSLQNFAFNDCQLSFGPVRIEAVSQSD